MGSEMCIRDKAGALSFDVMFEGEKLVREAFQFPHRVSAVYALDPSGIGDVPPLAEKFIVSEKQARMLSGMDEFPGIACLVEMYHPTQLRADESAIYLHQVQDPGNVGTIVRLAHWYAVPKLLLSPGCASPFNQKVIQASMGSMMYVDVIPDANLPAMIQGQVLYACDLEGTSVEKIAFTRPLVLCMGNESQGFASTPVENAISVTIPRLHSTINSLNVAMACGIVLDRIRTQS